MTPTEIQKDHTSTFSEAIEKTLEATEALRGIIEIKRTGGIKAIHEAFISLSDDVRDKFLEEVFAGHIRVIEILSEILLEPRENSGISGDSAKRTLEIVNGDRDTVRGYVPAE